MFSLIWVLSAPHLSDNLLDTPYSSQHLSRKWYPRWSYSSNSSQHSWYDASGGKLLGIRKESDRKHSMETHSHSVRQDFELF